MARYSKAAAKKVARAVKKAKAGTLRSGRSDRKVTSRKQAIAIGLSEARAEGRKVPRKPKKAPKRTAKKSVNTSVKKAAARKKTAKKTRKVKKAKRTS